jgi:hypothetical protein
MVLTKLMYLVNQVHDIMSTIDRNRMEQKFCYLVSSEQVRYRSPTGACFDEPVRSIWNYEDYEYCFLHSDIWKQYRKVLGLKEDATDDQRRAVLVDRYFYAGTNARYMFEYTIDEIKTDIDGHVRTAGSDEDLSKLLQVRPGSLAAVNHLITYRGESAIGVTSLYVVKSMALAQFTENTTVETFAALAELAHNTFNNGLLGWVFENEVSYRIKNTKENFVFCDENGAVAQDLLSIQGLTPAGLSSEDVYTIEFIDEDDFINKLVKLCASVSASSTTTAPATSSILASSVWCYPMICSNAFYDFANIQSISRQLMKDYQHLTTRSTMWR